MYAGYNPRSILCCPVQAVEAIPQAILYYHKPIAVSGFITTARAAQFMFRIKMFDLCLYPKG